VLGRRIVNCHEKCLIGKPGASPLGEAPGLFVLPNAGCWSPGLVIAG